MPRRITKRVKRTTKKSQKSQKSQKQKQKQHVKVSVKVNSSGGGGGGGGSGGSAPQQPIQLQPQQVYEKKSQSPSVPVPVAQATSSSQTTSTPPDNSEQNALLQNLLNSNQRILQNQQFHHSLIDEVMMNLNNQQDTLNGLGNNNVYQQQVINQLLVQRNKEEAPTAPPTLNENQIESMIRNSLQSVLHRDQPFGSIDRNIFQQLKENGEDSSMDIVTTSSSSNTTSPLIQQIENGAQQPLPQTFINNIYHYHPPIQSTENRTINQNLLTLNRSDLPNDFFQQSQDLVLNTADGSVEQPPFMRSSSPELETDEEKRQRMQEEHIRFVNQEHENQFAEFALRHSQKNGIENGSKQEQRAQELAILKKRMKNQLQILCEICNYKVLFHQRDLLKHQLKML